MSDFKSRSQSADHACDSKQVTCILSSLVPLNSLISTCTCHMNRVTVN